MSAACACGHGKDAHPYVGRIASWPTRCLYCECLGYKPADQTRDAAKDFPHGGIIQPSWADEGFAAEAQAAREFFEPRGYRVHVRTNARQIVLTKEKP